jgi:hypothetical protein
VLSDGLTAAHRVLYARHVYVGRCPARCRMLRGSPARCRMLRGRPARCRIMRGRPLRGRPAAPVNSASAGALLSDEHQRLSDELKHRRAALSVAALAEQAACATDNIQTYLPHAQYAGVGLCASVAPRDGQPTAVQRCMCTAHR